MSDDLATEITPTPTVKSPEIVSKYAIDRLRETWEPVKTIDDAHNALERMPLGKKGVVVGAGPKSSEWKAKGWDTLDLDPKYPDLTYVANANHMVKDSEDSPNPLDKESQDYIYAENLRFDPEGKKGAGRGRLLQQSNQALKTGGVLIVESANIKGHPLSTLPEREWYAQEMANHGFNTVVVLDFIREDETPFGAVHAQKVYYIGEKVANGYDPSRVTKS